MMRKPEITQDPAAWRIGYQAGQAGNPKDCPPDVDALAFWSGVIEGKAARGKEPQVRFVSTPSLKPEPV